MAAIWEELYHALVVQTDRQEIKRKCHETKTAIVLRLQSLDFSQSEYHNLATTSAALLVLEHERLHGSPMLDLSSRVRGPKASSPDSKRNSGPLLAGPPALQDVVAPYGHGPR
jgi:hypothetical protein